MWGTERPGLWSLSPQHPSLACRGGLSSSVLLWPSQKQWVLAGRASSVNGHAPGQRARFPLPHSTACSRPQMRTSHRQTSRPSPAEPQAGSRGLGSPSHPNSGGWPRPPQASLRSPCPRSKRLCTHCPQHTLAHTADDRVLREKVDLTASMTCWVQHLLNKDLVLLPLVLPHLRDKDASISLLHLLLTSSPPALPPGLLLRSQEARDTTHRADGAGRWGEAPRPAAPPP